MIGLKANVSLRVFRSEDGGGDRAPKFSKPIYEFT